MDERVSEIMGTLSNRDALLLFNLAEEGIETINTVNNYGLSKKRYYQRLNELLSLGLVFKDGSRYKHTMLGSMIFENQIKGLRQLLLNRGNIDILHELRNRLQDNDSKTAIENISQEVLKNLESSLGVSGLKPIRLLRSWDELAQLLNSRIEFMRTEMIVASRYVDFRTAKAAAAAASRNCNIRIIHSNREAFSERMQIFGNLLVNPQAIFTYRDLVKSPNVSMRKSYVPYSFLVIDSLYVGIEVVNPSDPSLFFLGFYFESTVLAQNMKRYFDVLWTKGETDDMTIMFERPVEEILREIKESSHVNNKILDADHSI